jgi:hypothetical protein
VPARRQNLLRAVRIDPMEALDYWTKGISLKNAARHFASRKLWEKYEDTVITRDRQLMDANKRMMAVEPEHHQPVALSDAFLTAGVILAERIMAGCAAQSLVDDVEFEMRRELCVRVWAGNPVALGYVLPREAGDLPVIIPLDIFVIGNLNDGAEDALNGSRRDLQAWIDARLCAGTTPQRSTRCHDPTVTPVLDRPGETPFDGVC